MRATDMQTATQTEETRPTANVSLCATYHATRPDLRQGREWLVNGKYVVTVWVEEENGRMASCRCKAFTFGLPCKHIRFVQLCDSYLTGEPVREVKPVYVKAAVGNSDIPF